MPPIPSKLEWSQLPPLPDPEGFAGMFAGVSGGALIVAGGANISARRWEPAFAKSWYGSAFVLTEPGGQWRGGFTLPKPAAYGVSITWNDTLCCLGGQNADGHLRECHSLTWRAGRLVAAALPPLPRPCANACGALVGSTIYLAGGLETPAGTTALKTFWALDLEAGAKIWRELEPWPGPERMLAVAGAWHDEFFLMSGTRLSAGADGKPVREYLRDAYAFHPGRGWRRLADLPRATVAAPSPALARPDGLLIVSGDDGANVDFAPVEKHPGFPRDALLYDPAKNQWSATGAIPFSRATVPTVSWNGRTVIPNGEVRPRVRTNEVWTAR